MFQVETHEISKDIQRIRFMQDRTLLSTQAVLTLLRDDETFRQAFIDALLSMPYLAFRWETPALVKKTLSAPFECVIVNSPRLERAASQRFFAEHFNNAEQRDLIINFQNLGGDALLIVPTPQTVDKAYTHLASFTRAASKAQNHALWQAIGKLTLVQCSDVPIWLNTAGGGVPWLHVRLDSRPKYYRYAPYKTAVE